MTDRSRYQSTMALSPTRAPLAGLLAVAIAAIWAAPAAAAPATYDGIAADGHVAIFSTTEQMVPGDTDGQVDVYTRAKDAGLGEYVTREASIGPLGGNDAYAAQYDGVSADGNRVFFSTEEPLVAADGDHSEDVYMRDLEANTTTLVSQGDASCAAEGCGDGAVEATFAAGGVAADGERVFFDTTEKLNAADADAMHDVYMRDLAAGETVLVSQGDPACEGCGNGPHAASFEAASEDGLKAFFTSTEGLVAGDVDGTLDVYVRDLAGEETALASGGGSCPVGLPSGENCEPIFAGIAIDGSHVYFESNEQISTADEDVYQDLYDWSGSGAAALASTGPSGGNAAEKNATSTPVQGPIGAVYFYTDEAVDPGADEDATSDVYVRAGGVTKLVSTGPESRNGPAPPTLAWASTETGSEVAIFSTAEALVPEDTDAMPDVYERDLAGGETTLISQGDSSCVGSGCGNGAFGASFSGASADGSRVFFVTVEPLVEGDEDASADIYLRSGGQTRLISTGPLGGNGAFPVDLHGVSADGSQGFFTTNERLTVDDDFAQELDVYSWTAGKTEGAAPTVLLVSAKNSNELVLGPPPPFLEGTNPASPAETTEPSLFGQAEAGATITVYTNSSCSGEAVPPGGAAEELSGAGIPVTVAAGTKTTFYATAEVDGVVSSCSNGVSYKQEMAAPPPPPEEEGGSGGGGGEGGSGGGGSEEGGGSGGSTVPDGGLGGLDQYGSGALGDPGPSLVTPKAAITFGPASKTRKHKVVFRFSDATGQAGTRFVCKLDRQRWKKCGSPKRLKKLHFGRHTFAVKAVNQAGVWSQGAAKRKFKVVR